MCSPEGSDNCMNLEPGLTEIMANSVDYEELTYVWKVGSINFEASLKVKEPGVAYAPKNFANL